MAWPRKDRFDPCVRHHCDARGPVPAGSPDRGRRRRPGVAGNGSCPGPAGGGQAAAIRIRPAPGDSGTVPGGSPARRLVVTPGDRPGVRLRRRRLARIAIPGDGAGRRAIAGPGADRQAAGSAPLTSTGTLVGTPAYLAPERAAGAKATPASDLYSLGVVAYECLVGTVPFGGSPLEVAAAHRSRALPPLPGGVPSGVAELVAELTAKDPAARPAGAASVAERAGRLRGIPAGATVRRGADQIPPAAAASEAQPATLIHAIPPDFAEGLPPTHGRRPDTRSWPSRGMALALAAVAVIAGLVG